MNNLYIRRFQTDDADAISAMIRRNFVEVNIRDYPIEEMERLSGYYNSDKVAEIGGYAHLYVACLDGTIVGCGAVAVYNGEQDESILLTFFVLPDFHGKGIGRAIIETLERDIYFSRAKRVEIHASITACDFYIKMGYVHKDGLKELDQDGLYRLEKFR